MLTWEKQPENRSLCNSFHFPTDLSVYIQEYNDMQSDLHDSSHENNSQPKIAGPWWPFNRV